MKTIVTSQMANAVADRFGVKCYDCLTGFKYIAKIIRENEGKDQVHRRRRGVVRLPSRATTCATRTAFRPARWRPKPQRGRWTRWV